MKRIIVLSGAGFSAESGVKTFRDANGLWENHDIIEVASIEGWKKNPALVLDFYNQRRRQLKHVQPNAAHFSIVELEKYFDVTVITQKVDDLHERAGSKTVIHLHGELRKARSTVAPNLIYDWDQDLNLGDCCDDGGQLRPHIVWFGEAVPLIERAAVAIYDSDIVIIVGTSLQVYPAAGLIGYARSSAQIYYIDPRPSINYELARSDNLTVIEEKATVGMKKVVEELVHIKEKTHTD